MKLPVTEWSGRFIEIGCGGRCGSTRFNYLISWCNHALRKGYACIVSDQGHASRKGDGRPSDAVWAYDNLQAEIDYGFRAAHVAALAGKAIAQRYYGAAPTYSYFMGCSGGGRQALVEAQRFPWDFDGIVAMDPAVDLSSLFMVMHWNALATTDVDGKSLFTSGDINVLHGAAVTQCNLDDGVSDGVIGYPPSCKFDPTKLACKKGQVSGCLSRAQVAAAQKVYSGPVTSKGEKLSAGGAVPGAEKGVFGFSEAPQFQTDFFRYMGFMPDPGPSWKARDFDFDVDYRRLGLMGSIYASNNPDLRRFKAEGGKLIVAQGWNDSGLPPLRTIDYYEMVERIIGGRASTQEFARLFMMPGRAHCGDGPGANAVDVLGYLERWVELGDAPDLMIGAHVASGDVADYIKGPNDLSDKVKFTRPLYPYPLHAKYQGTGDPNDYRSFSPFDPTSK